MMQVHIYDVFVMSVFIKEEASLRCNNTFKKENHKTKRKGNIALCCCISVLCVLCVCFVFCFCLFVCLFSYLCVWSDFWIFSRQEFSICPWLSGTHSVKHAGLVLRNLPTSASHVLALKLCTTNTLQILPFLVRYF